MGGIADEHVEWAVVNRLKAMLDKPPTTKFNVTQSFALFSAIVLWTKQRAWVGGNQLDRAEWFDEADHAVRNAREALQAASIFEAPWLLSKSPPNLAVVDGDSARAVIDVEINAEFAGMNVEQFVAWLRNALAHGDGRTVKPIHKPSRKSNKTLLAGFEVVFPTAMGSNRNLTLSLYHADMTRIGSVLADAFCQALSGGNRYFEQEAGTASIEEAA